MKGSYRASRLHAFTALVQKLTASPDDRQAAASFGAVYGPLAFPENSEERIALLQALTNPDCPFTCTTSRACLGLQSPCSILQKIVGKNISGADDGEAIENALRGKSQIFPGVEVLSDLSEKWWESNHPNALQNSICRWISANVGQYVQAWQPNHRFLGNAVTCRSFYTHSLKPERMLPFVTKLIKAGWSLPLDSELVQSVQTSQTCRIPGSILTSRVGPVQNDVFLIKKSKYTMENPFQDGY